MNPKVWDLFVDESGDFDLESNKVLVAGVLIPSDRLLGHEDEIRQRLAGLVPGFPWPLHTCILRKSSTAVAAHLVLRIRAVDLLLTEERETLLRAFEEITAGRVPDASLVGPLEQAIAGREQNLASISLDVPKYLSNHMNQLIEIMRSSGERAPLAEPLWTGEEWGSKPDPHLANAANLLLEHARDAVVQATRKMTTGRHPDYELLNLLDRVLRKSDPTLAQVLEGIAFRSVAAIHRVLATMADPTVGDTASLVLASESRPGDFVPPGDGTDRYLSLLEAMLTRVAEVLHRHDGFHLVHVRVATRALNVTNPPNDEHLDCERHLAPLCKRIQEDGRFSNVLLLATETPKFRYTSHVGWVFADYAANCSRSAIGPRRLLELEKRVVKETALPVRSGDPPRTHVQAAGWAFQALSALRTSGTVAIEPPPNVWPWALEQAKEWGET